MTELGEAAAAALHSAKTPARIADLVDRLGLDKTLAWHLKVLCDNGSPLANAEHVPGPEATRIFVEALRKNGASAASRRRFELAVAAFDELLAREGGDRRTLAAMLGAFVDEPAGQRTLELARRAAFRANSAIYGINCRTQFQFDFACLDEKGMLDLAVIRGWLGFARLRADSAWLGARSRQHVEGKRVETGLSVPLEPDAADRFGLPLVTRFCSSPLPKFRESKLARGDVNCYVADGPIGRAGQIDLVFGELLRGIAPPAAPIPDQHGEVFSRLYTPAELFVHEWLLERKLVEGVWRDRSPQLIVFNELGASLQHPNGESDKPRLPAPAVVERVGPADLAPPPDKSIRYREMIRYVCESLGRSPEDFVVYRVRIKHPPIPCTGALPIALPIGHTGCGDVAEKQRDGGNVDAHRSVEPSGSSIQASS